MINLLTNKQKKIIHRIRITRVWITVLFASISFFVVSMLLLLPLVIVLRGKQAVLQQEKKLITGDTAVTYEEVVALSKRVTDTSTLFTPTASEENIRYLQEIRQQSSAGVTLTRIEVATRDKKVVEIGGVADTRSALSEYERRLRENPQIDKVESPVSNYVKNQNTIFSIRVFFK